MIRIGIDVGGTFTDVVAVDAATRTLLATIKLPTTHDHAEGVAAGIVAGLEQLMRDYRIAPSDVAFIAHSTTQATNALLEGDVARVGVVCVGSPLARAAMRFAPIPLGPALRFTPRFFEHPGDDDRVLDTMQAAGIEAFVASEAFGVDRPARELQFIERARARGLAATSGSDVSAMYGLRARTRTAALNAAILPRMLATARVTRRAVEAAGITAPLMIMRSDGGVMDVAEVERRPILTMLSGPAAGIAGALFAENVTDGIFIEVGGTSADCSVIRRGRPEVRPARIGGQRTLVQTLDVRTLAVAGGSLAHVENGRIVAVGPRSAHIAGYAYAVFSERAAIERAVVAMDDVLALIDGTTRIAITPTCAANVLGLVPSGAFAGGDAAVARRACERVGALLGLDADGVARAILDRTTATLRTTIDELIEDYALERSDVELIAGGGGAAALVPYAAAALGLRFRLAAHAEVISPLGVALALVQDVVERTIIDPTPAAIAALRREAIDAAIRSGAAAERIEVAIEIDRARNRVRAVASGATALLEGATTVVRVNDDERRASALRALRALHGDLVVSTAACWVMQAQGGVAVVDERAVVRLIVRGGSARATTGADVRASVEHALEDATRYGDVGRSLPDLWIVVGARIIACVGIPDGASALALIDDDLRASAADAPIGLIVRENLG